MPPGGTRPPHCSCARWLVGELVGSACCSLRAFVVHAICCHTVACYNAALALARLAPVRPSRRFSRVSSGHIDDSAQLAARCVVCCMLSFACRMVYDACDISILLAPHSERGQQLYVYVRPAPLRVNTCKRTRSPRSHPIARRVLRGSTTTQHRPIGANTRTQLAHNHTSTRQERACLRSWRVLARV